MIINHRIHIRYQVRYLWMNVCNMSPLNLARRTNATVRFKLNSNLAIAVITNAQLPE